MLWVAYRSIPVAFNIYMFNSWHVLAKFFLCLLFCHKIFDICLRALSVFFMFYTLFFVIVINSVGIFSFIKDNIINFSVNSFVRSDRTGQLKQIFQYYFTDWTNIDLKFNIYLDKKLPCFYILTMFFGSYLPFLKWGIVFHKKQHLFQLMERIEQFLG